MTIMVESNSPVRVVVVVSHLGLGGAERQTSTSSRQLRGSPGRRWGSSASRPVSAHTARRWRRSVSALDRARASGFDVGRWWGFDDCSAARAT